MKTIILASDNGFAVDGINESLPKAMIQVDGKPMLEYVLDALDFIDKADITIVVSYKKEEIINRFGSDYNYAVQKETLGTGNAVASVDVSQFLGEDVLICYCDMPLISKDIYKEIIKEHKQSSADCTILTAIVPKSPLKYGRVIREKGEFSDIIEYSKASKSQRSIDELNLGIYVIKAELINKQKTQLLTEGKPLTDLPKETLENGGKVLAYSMKNSNKIYGINNDDQLHLCSEIVRHSKELIDTTPKKWFGTGGWRAFIGEDFTKDNLKILMQAISEHMVSKGERYVVIGYDRRFLSDKAAIWAAETFSANGIDVFFISKVAPTPLVMFTVANIKADLGIAITASHNPADYNGVKVFLSDGSDAPVEFTNTFEEIIADGVTVKSMPFNEGIEEGIIHLIDPNNDYVDSIIALINMQAIRSKNLRIVLDPMFGVSKPALQTVLMTARADVDIINEEHDALFGGQLPSPTAQSLTKLRDTVLHGKYDLGIGTDGDADRIGIIDNVGRFVHPNEILILLYHYLLKYKGEKGDAVRNISTTHILDVIAERHGQKCHEVPVGFKNISAAMGEYDALIGGESSGGLTIRGHIKGKDGIFASALVVEMICVTEKTIPELLIEINEEYGKMVQLEYEATFSEEQKELLISKLFVRKELPKYSYPIIRVGYEDGCKIYFENNGWIAVRFSGTEPLIRIFAEMPTEEMSAEIIKIMADFLQL